MHVIQLKALKKFMKSPILVQLRQNRIAAALSIFSPLY